MIFACVVTFVGAICGSSKARPSPDPPEGFEVLQQVVVLRYSTLGYPCNDLDPLDLLVVRGGDTIHKRGNLGAEVRSRDERSEDVLWKDVVGERTCIVLDAVVGGVDVLQTQRQVRGGDCANPPVGFAAEHLLLVVGRSDGLNYVTVDVDRLRRRGDFLTEDDITNLAGGERSDVDHVSFSEILWVCSEKARITVSIGNVRPR